MEATHRLRTLEELLTISEQNYHGAIQSLFIARLAFGGQHPTVREVLEVLERRFGMTNEVTGELTTIEITEMLVAGLADARQHLRADTIDWYNQRVDYLLRCAAERKKPE